MRHPGFKHTKNTIKLLCIRAKSRGNNGWLNRKHRVDSIAKMRGPKSEEHKHNMSLAAIKRWNKPVWYNRPKPKVDPPQPVVNRYQDIFMNDVDIDSEGVIWYEV